MNWTTSRATAIAGRRRGAIGPIFLVCLACGAFVALATAAISACAADDAAATPDALTMVVMDPLAKPLSCPCVKGYAQRDYDQLAKRLERELGRPVHVVYNESLTTALKGNAKGQAQLVIGKHSVVEFDANRSGLKLQPVAKLTNKAGGTTITGLIVVPKEDSARSVAELNGYRIVLGPEECDEKHSAAIALLKKNGVALPETLETSGTCSEGACSVIEHVQTQHGAAVISSYARPLLEGCGTVQKGALRLIGETEPVPFIEAFVNEQLPETQRRQLAAALVNATSDPFLRLALETHDGFVPMPEETAEVAKKK